MLVCRRRGSLADWDLGSTFKLTDLNPYGMYYELIIEGSHVVKTYSKTSEVELYEYWVFFIILLEVVSNFIGRCKYEFEINGNALTWLPCLISVEWCRSFNANLINEAVTGVVVIRCRKNRLLGRDLSMKFWPFTNEISTNIVQSR